MTGICEFYMLSSWFCGILVKNMDTFLIGISQHLSVWSFRGFRGSQAPFGLAWSSFYSGATFSLFLWSLLISLYIQWGFFTSCSRVLVEILSPCHLWESSVWQLPGNFLRNSSWLLSRNLSWYTGFYLVNYWREPSLNTGSLSLLSGALLHKF